MCQGEKERKSLTHTQREREPTYTHTQVVRQTSPSVCGQRGRGGSDGEGGSATEGHESWKAADTCVGASFDRGRTERERERERGGEKWQNMLVWH